MRTAAVFSLLSALVASAMPTTYPIYRKALSGRATGPTDTQVLQYALTLENLEKTFYAQALSNFTESDFVAAGYPGWVYGRYKQIGSHEADHVSELSAALGNDSVAPCTYDFPYTDVKSFVSLATLIENVGVSAYAGAAQYISNPAYVTVAAIILTTEARHQTWQMSAVAGQNPWSTAYDTPLGLDMVYTIASAFITSCPSSNAALPVMAFPSLTVDGAAAGANVAFTFNGSSSMDGVAKNAIFYNGLGTQTVALDENNMATIPSALMGISYVVVSTAGNATAVTNSNIVAGPAILSFPFGSNVADPSFTGMM